LSRSAVLACVAVATVAVIGRYPEALSELTDTARANALLSFADREIAGGNAVIPDQQAMYEARARIPVDASYEVAVGVPVKGWSSLTADYAQGYTTYFLLPRRPVVGAPWVICFNCDRKRYRGDVVWKDVEGVSIIRRSG